MIPRKLPRRELHTSRTEPLRWPCPKCGSAVDTVCLGVRVDRGIVPMRPHRERFQFWKIERMKETSR